MHEVFSPKDFLSPRSKNGGVGVGGNTISTRMFPPIENPIMLPKIEDKNMGSPYQSNVNLNLNTMMGDNSDKNFIA